MSCRRTTSSLGRCSVTISSRWSRWSGFLAYVASIETSPNTIKAYAHPQRDWFTSLVAHLRDWRTASWRMLPASRPGCGCRRRSATARSWCCLPWASLLGRQREPQARCADVLLWIPARHGVELAGLLVTMQPANRRGAAATAYKPSLHHVTKIKPEQRRAITLKTVQSRPKMPIVQQVQTILDACDHLRDRLLFALPLDTGVRTGEALGLRHEDLDIAGRVRPCARGRTTTGPRQGRGVPDAGRPQAKSTVSASHSTPTVHSDKHNGPRPDTESRPTP